MRLKSIYRKHIDTESKERDVHYLVLNWHVDFRSTTCCLLLNSRRFAVYPLTLLSINPFNLPLHGIRLQGVSGVYNFALIEIALRLCESVDCWRSIRIRELRLICDTWSSSASRKKSLAEIGSSKLLRISSPAEEDFSWDQYPLTFLSFPPFDMLGQNI